MSLRLSSSSTRQKFCPLDKRHTSVSYPFLPVSISRAYLGRITHLLAANLSFFRCKNCIAMNSLSACSVPRKLGLALLGGRRMYCLFRSHLLIGYLGQVFLGEGEDDPLAKLRPSLQKCRKHPDSGCTLCVRTE